MTNAVAAYGTNSPATQADALQRAPTYINGQMSNQLMSQFLSGVGRQYLPPHNQRMIPQGAIAHLTMQPATAATAVTDATSATAANSGKNNMNTTFVSTKKGGKSKKRKQSKQRHKKMKRKTRR